MSIPTFPSTMLVDIKSNDPKEINDQVNKALNSLLSSLNKLSSSIRFITQAQAAALFAPMPQSAAGVGQFTIQNAQGFTLPAGGTWSYLAIQFLNATGAFSGGFWAGIAAGGTTITGGTAGYTIYGWVWRIA